MPPKPSPRSASATFQSSCCSYMHNRERRGKWLTATEKRRLSFLSTRLSTRPVGLARLGSPVLNLGVVLSILRATVPLDSGYRRRQREASFSHNSSVRSVLSLEMVVRDDDA